MIEIENLTHVYSGGKVALDDVTLDLEPGGIRAILGRSGSGKTTLLMCLGRFLEPDSGRISIDGEDLAGLEETELRRTVGIVFQDLHLFPHLDVLENLTLAPTKVLDQEPGEAEATARAALDRLGISELAGSYAAEISGGEAQRVAIARALVLEPRYLLLDEPTSALDVKTSREFGDWLLSLEEETTFILVTHDAPFARATASSGVLLEKGRVAASGSIEEVLKVLEGEDG